MVFQSFIAPAASIMTLEIRSELHSESSQEAPAQGGCDRLHQADVVIVGGGLSGAVAAVVLGRAGYRVTLVDRHAVYPPEFRVEKIAGDQVELIRRLGLLDSVAAAATPFDEILNFRRGQLLDQSTSRHYGIMYADILKAVRAQIPPSVEFVVARALDIETGPERQRIALNNDDVVEARLVVLATGMSDVLRQKLGIKRHIVFENQCLSFGFSIRPGPGETFDFPALTYYGEELTDRIDYLNLFPVGDVMRGNLFTFRDHRDPWIREMRRDPKGTLFGVMPGLKRFLGDFQVVDKVQNWLMDLYVVGNYRCDGVVLIGDSFQTSCPAAGTGVSRLLTDVDRLCNVHLPHWFATPGMAAGKIAQFYDDPVKQTSDNRAARLAGYRRSLAIDPRIRWALERQQVYFRRRLIGWVKELSGRRATRAQPTSSGRARKSPAVSRRSGPQE
jgi:2-polyprenyl-6-methoxyphenol hydroxylase-like FAD-dependent oxidoreductase